MVSVHGSEQVRAPTFGTTVSFCDRQLPGDCTQDSRLDISDAICAFGILFLGRPLAFPCGDGSVSDGANVALIDWQPDGRVDISDGIGVLQHLFGGGHPHPLGRGCVRIEGCREACRL